MNKYEPVSIIFLAYNEASTIENEVYSFYNEIIKKIPDSEFIIAEDGSTDGTTEILQKLSNELGIIHLTSKERKGYAKAFKNAVFSARKEYIFLTDTGLKHNHKDFWKLYEQRQKYDLIVGKKTDRKDQFYRRFLTYSYNFLLRLFFRINNVYDADSGFRLFNKRVVTEVFAGQLIFKELLNSEIVLRTVLKGLKYKEIPISYIQRQGTSRGLPLKKIPKVILSTLINLIRLKNMKNKNKYTKKKKVLESSSNDTSAFFLSFILILGIFIVNLLMPSSHFFWSINFMGYLPVWFQFFWFILFIVLIYCVHKMKIENNFSGSNIWYFLLGLFAILAIGSSILFPAKYPGIIGDTLIRDNFRLRGYISTYLKKQGMTTKSIGYYFSIFSNIFYTLGAFFIALRLSKNKLIKFSCFIFLITAPLVLSFYAWFDNYSLTVVFQLFFFIVFYEFYKAQKLYAKIALGSFVIILSLCGLGIHPINNVFVLFIGLFFALLLTQKYFPNKIKIIFPASLIFFLLLIVYKWSYPWCQEPNSPSDINRSFLTDLLPISIHGGFSIVLQVALPGILFWLLMRTNFKKLITNPKAYQTSLFYCALITILIGINVCISGNATQWFMESIGGTNIAFCLPIAIPALFLWCESYSSKKIILYISLFSMFFTFPIVWSSVSDPFVTRFEDMLPFEQSFFERMCTPHIHLGLHMKDDPLLHESALNQFRLGMKDPKWKGAAIANQMYLTAWSYEFGHEAEGRTNLYYLYNKYPQAAAQSLLRKGAQFTKNAHIPIRRDTKKICSELYSKTKHSIYQQILQVIPQFEKADAANKTK